MKDEVVLDNARRTKVRDSTNARSRSVTKQKLPSEQRLRILSEAQLAREHLRAENVSKLEQAVEECQLTSESGVYLGMPTYLRGSEFEEFEELSSEGGTSQLLRGENGNLDNHVPKDVAIKRARTGLYTGDKEQFDRRLNRFFNEVGLLGKLDHDALPVVYGCYTKGYGNTRYPHIVMERINGKSLSCRVGNDNDIGLVVDWTKQILDFFGYLHSKDVVYRDMKPGNVVIDKGNKVRVVDLGGSTDKADKTLGQTVDGTVVGTPKYMAPEALLGDASQASDIYSLGITLYDLLCSEPVEEGVKGKTYENLNFDLLEKSVYAKTKDVNATKVLVDLVKDMTRKNHFGRLQNVTEVLEQIGKYEQCLDKESVPRLEREISDWDVPIEETVHHITYEVLHKKNRDVKKVDLLNKRLNDERELLRDRDRIVIDKTIEMIMDGINDDEIEEYLETFNEENPELIQGYTRTDLSQIYGTMFGRHDVHDYQYNTYLKQIKESPQLMKMIEKLGRAGVSDTDFEKIYKGILESNRSGFREVDQNEFNLMLKLVKNGELEDRVNAIKEKYAAAEYASMELHDDRYATLFLMMEDEGLEYISRELYERAKTDYFTIINSSYLDHKELDIVKSIAVGVISGAMLGFIFGVTQQELIYNLLNITTNYDMLNEIQKLDFTDDSILYGTMAGATLGTTVSAGLNKALNKISNSLNNKHRLDTGYDNRISRHYARNKVHDKMFEMIEAVPVDKLGSILDEVYPFSKHCPKSNRELTPYEIMDNVMLKLKTS